MLVYRVHWLRAKAMMDWWLEEEELLEAEFRWTISYFANHAEAWQHQSIVCQKKGWSGPACYAARQCTVYSRLWDQCQTEWENYLSSQTTGGHSSPLGTPL